jgi:hypothetical protein
MAPQGVEHSQNAHSLSQPMLENEPTGPGVEETYAIPMRFRRVENLHILLWLLKDACWAMNLRWAGVLMIVPTLAVAILITWQTRHMRAECLHNLAVDFWITANCTWMIGEFFGWDEGVVGGYGLRQIAVIPFSIGLLLLVPYYFARVSRGAPVK